MTERTDNKGAPQAAPPTRARRSRITTVAIIVATLVSLVTVSMRLHLEPDVASLLPDRGDSAALRRYVRAFGGGDLAVVMVKGPDPDANAAAANEVAHGLEAKPSIEHVAYHLDTSRAIDPMLLFRHADPIATAKLRAALEPAAMRERLLDTRRMLLAPGSSALSDVVVKDPLRLFAVVFDKPQIGAGSIRTQPNGGFSTDDGTMQLVFAKPKGQALRGADARAFVDDANAVLGPIARAHPNVTLGLTGGHAIAAASEEMLTRDLELSGLLSMVLASAVFALIFRRLRALIAVMPPLILGTLWTAGLATLFPSGLSAIAVAFTSVVVGVGVDTGVHVYAALLEARRAGLSPDDAAQAARDKTTRHVMMAAITAGAAFGALALSDINAVRQLGILCGAGEVLTAVAIVAITPTVGAWLERGPPPPASRSRWTEKVAWLTATRPRAFVMAAIMLAAIPAVALGAGPELAESVIAIRPKKLEPLRVQQEIYDAFGGKKGQWVILVADPDIEHARERGDRIAERLAAMPDDVEALDALTAIAPANSTQVRRFDARDALGLDAKADELERALTETGFAPARFEEALENMRHPPRTMVSLEDLKKGPGAILTSRYVGHDGNDELIALYVRPSDAKGAATRLAEAVREVDPDAVLTGYSRLESSLRETLRHDLPRIGLVAGLLVVLALAASLRRARDVLLAALVVTGEVAAVLILIRVLGIPLHAYDALVLPVLLGITVDEGMFLLHHAREASGDDVVKETLRHEGPAIAATALTTAAGFAALGVCDFDGLRDLGWVGALGSTVGLIVALVVVPAGLRLFQPAK